MSDEKRTVKDETGRNEPTDDTEGHQRNFRQPTPAIPGQPDPAFRGGRRPGESADGDDTEGHGGRFPQPDPAYRGGARRPVEAADGDTEGHQRNFRQPTPAIPGQPDPAYRGGRRPGESADDDDTEGHGMKQRR